MRKAKNAFLPAYLRDEHTLLREDFRDVPTIPNELLIAIGQEKDLSDSEEKDLERSIERAKRELNLRRSQADREFQLTRENCVLTED